MDRAAVNALEMEEPEHKLTPIVRIILESGLINAAFLFAFVMTLVFGSSSLEIMSEMVRARMSLRLDAACSTLRGSASTLGSH